MNKRSSEQILNINQSHSSERYSALSSYELGEFFKQTQSNHREIASSLTENVQNKLEEALNRGEVNIQLGSVTEQSKSSLNHLNNKKHKLERELELLNHLIQSEKFKPIRALNSSGLTSEDHLKVVNKIKKDKKQRDQKREMYVKDLGEKREEQQTKERLLSQKSRERINEEKRTRIQENIKRREEKKSLSSKSRSLNESQRNKKILYRQLEDRYIKEVVLPAIEERNSKIKEIKSLKRPIRIDEIRKHEQNYMMMRQEMANSSISKREEPVYYQPSFKSGRYENRRKQEEEEKRSRDEEKKASLSARVERIESFKRYVADNFKPTISEEKRKDLEEKIQLQVSKPRSNSINVYQKGVQYLNYSKSLGKKEWSNPQQTIDLHNISEKIRPNSNKPNYISPDPVWVPTKLQKIQNLIKSTNISSDDKLEELKVQTQILDELIQGKQKFARVKELKDKSDSSQLLLASIKARIGMLEIYHT